MRELMDEVFGPENFVVTILLKKKGGQKGGTLDPINDYILWGTKDIARATPRIRKLFVKIPREDLADTFRYVEMPDGREVTLADLGKQREVDYRRAIERIFEDFPGARLFASENLTSGGFRRTQSVIFKFRGMPFDPSSGTIRCLSRIRAGKRAMNRSIPPSHVSMYVGRTWMS